MEHRQDAAAAAVAAARPGSVFRLYQEGLTPDQVLQLCYLRRRAPRRLSSRIEDEFVLPRPEIKIASLLPPVDASLKQLVGAAPASAPSSASAAATSAPSDAGLDRARESARLHFLHPGAAAVDVVRQWSMLAERDWLQIHRSLQRAKQPQEGQDDEMTGLAAVQLPSIADVCWTLEQCRSDAFACFVWDHLLVPLLQRCADSQSAAAEHERLLALLVNHPTLASLSPKDFRAKVRARNLRQVDDDLGAQAELALTQQQDGASPRRSEENGGEAGHRQNQQAEHSSSKGQVQAACVQSSVAVAHEYGFSFKKLQPKPGEGKKKTTARPSEKPAFSVAKPFLGKFSVCGLAKRSLVPASEAWARTSKTPSTTPRTESGLPLAFRADTKSSAAKKRKTLESRTHEHKSNAFPSKNRRTENNGSFEQKSSFRIDARTEKLAVKGSDTFRAGLSLSGNKAMKQSRDLVKKRGLLLTSVDVDPEPKRLKQMAQIYASMKACLISNSNTFVRKAQVSESLLDALTDLMAEEGGIGIDKLNFDMNIDIDVGDAFLQDDEIQVLQ
ncbi:unnamed protein product [Phytophthora lilii]|uniref:Unnamed protein product n=1 Tax=Phytophthora lilii TaxID=2077276 RepID=A0A9W6TD10_9STRA|nr:unnamed protein product [Phytophthora lilii]